MEQKFYYISYWDIEDKMVRCNVIDFEPLEWQKRNRKEFTLISWQNISEDDYWQYWICV